MGVPQGSRSDPSDVAPATASETFMVITEKGRLWQHQGTISKTMCSEWDSNYTPTVRPHQTTQFTTKLHPTGEGGAARRSAAGGLDWSVVYGQVP